MIERLRETGIASDIYGEEIGNGSSASKNNKKKLKAESVPEAKEVLKTFSKPCIPIIDLYGHIQKKLDFTVFLHIEIILKNIIVFNNYT